MKSRMVRVCRRALCLVLCVCLCLFGASCHSRATPSRSWTSPKAWYRNGKTKKAPGYATCTARGLSAFIQCRIRPDRAPCRITPSPVRWSAAVKGRNRRGKGRVLSNGKDVKKQGKQTLGRGKTGKQRAEGRNMSPIIVHNNQKTTGYIVQVYKIKER